MIDAEHARLLVLMAHKDLDARGATSTSVSLVLVNGRPAL